jgi:hypothetical protein
MMISQLFVVDAVQLDSDLMTPLAEAFPGSRKRGLLELNKTPSEVLQMLPGTQEARTPPWTR